MLLGVCLVLLARALAVPVGSDPCAAIAGTLFSRPPDMLACLKSFPFNEILRQNILNTVSNVFNFYTFEDYYPTSNPPFTNRVNIRAELLRINSTSYAVSWFV